MSGRLASGDKAYFVTAPVAMTHNQYSHVRTQSKQDETVFIDRVFGVVDQPGEIIQEHSGSLAEVDAMLASISSRLRLIP